MFSRFARAVYSVVLAGCLVLGLLPGRSEAYPVTVDFTSTVGGVPSSLSSAFFTGQSVTASYTFESTTPVTTVPSIPTRGIYNGALTAFTLTIGSNTWSLATPGANNFIFIDNYTTFDRYQMTVTSLSGPSVGGTTPDHFILALDDNTAAAFGSTALPTSLPPLSAYTSAFWSFGFNDGTTSPPGISGGVATLSPTSSVPEPSTMLLLASGIVGLGYARRRLRV